MLRFTTPDGVVTLDGTALSGDKNIVIYIQGWIRLGYEVGCDYWGANTPGLSNPWQAYQTVCGVLTELYGPLHLVIEGPVPENPDGYEEEGAFNDDTEDS